MNYNIHPMIVHFPIALLVLYTIITILPLRKWIPSVAWKSVSHVLLVFGVLGAFAAASTGEVAEHLARPNRDLVEMHSLFASATIWLYGLILAGEIAALLNKRIIPKISIVVITKLFLCIERVLCNRIIVIILAILGLIAVTVTGLLGGVMVYGVTADPLAPFVLKILGLST